MKTNYNSTEKINILNPWTQNIVLTWTYKEIYDWVKKHTHRDDLKETLIEVRTAVKNDDSEALGVIILGS